MAGSEKASEFTLSGKKMLGLSHLIIFCKALFFNIFVVPMQIICDYLDDCISLNTHFFGI